MAQLRYFDFLADVSQMSLTSMHQDIFPNGVYVGCDLSIDGNNVMMAPGKFITTSGLIVEETAAVNIGSLGDQSAGTSQSLTIIGLGPSLSTVQSSAITYLINTGLLSDADIVVMNRPYVILGYALFDGEVWTAVSVPKVAPAVKTPSDVSLRHPFLMGQGAIVRYDGVGVVESVSKDANAKTITIPLNNELPLKHLDISCVGSTPGLMVEVSAFSDGQASVGLGLFTVDVNGTLTASIDVLEVNMRNVGLVLTLSGGAGTILFDAISYSQNAGYIAH